MRLFLSPFVAAPAALVAFVALIGGRPLAAQGAFDPAASLIRLADANGDGDVEASEWAAFLSGLDAAEDGALDARAVLARLAFRDQDGDGTFTASDVRDALAPDGGASLARFFLQALADRDESGDVSAAERDAFLATPAVAATPDGEPLSLAALADWIRAVEALPPPPADDRGRRVPPVVLASMMPVLDADSNGTLTVTDLNGLHRGADANGDGVVTAQELQSRQGPAFARWDVDPDRKAGPPLMPWQRTLEDALLLVERTGKPLLICVNMDDENASEVLAWNRYRDPEFAKLADGFVCVLASPDRREPVEHDDRGRRLPDRRFGRLLNSEHIDIEPKLFERYFNGTRVAPRHVGVGPDGTVLFDLYLLQDLSIIDAKLSEFGKPDAATAPDPKAMSGDELLESPDAGCRDELERRFSAADEAERARLAGLALDADRSVQHPELVRLALRDDGDDVRSAGAKLLGTAPGFFPLELVPEVFAAADRLGAGGDLDGAAGLSVQALAGLSAAARHADEAGNEQRAREARFLDRVYSKIEVPSRHLDPARWRVLLGGETPAPRPDYATLDYDAAIAQLDAVERTLSGNSDDVALLGRRADVLARIARIRMARAENPLYFLQDVERAADDVIARAPFDARALALKAWSLYHLNKLPESAIAATLALPHLAARAADPLTFEVLDVLATAKTREIYDAIAANRSWSDEAIPDARAAYAVLCAHPDATDAHWIRHLELLGALRAYPAQRAVVRDALGAWPASEQLHAWLRFVELRDAGSRALEAAYDEELLSSVDPSLEPAVTWFRGLAELFAAEHDVKCRDEAAAREAYAQSGIAFQESLDGAPGFAATVAHYSALVLSGLSRLQLADGRIDDAVITLTGALQAAPGSVEALDGLGKSPIDTARELIGVLERSDRAGQADALRAAAAEVGIDLAAGGR